MQWRNDGQVPHTAKGGPFVSLAFAGGEIVHDCYLRVLPFAAWCHDHGYPVVTRVFLETPAAWLVIPPVGETTNYPTDEAPIPMVLHCPRCHVQHIDEATPEWDNPPHRSHACQTPGCNTIWRPADVATAGVASIGTRGKSDTWAPA